MSISPRSTEVLIQLQGYLTPRVDRAGRLSDAWLERALTPLGVTMAQFRVIGAMLGTTDGLTQRELARRLRLDPTTISVAVAKLEALGYLERTVDVVDARARRVRPSASLPEFAEVMARLAELEAIATVGISAEDIAIAKNVLARIAHNLETALAPAVPNPQPTSTTETES